LIQVSNSIQQISPGTKKKSKKTQDRTCFMVGPLALLNHDCTSEITFGASKLFRTLLPEQDKTIWDGMTDVFLSTFQYSNRYITIKYLHEKIPFGEILVNYNLGEDTKQNEQKSFSSLDFDYKCNKLNK
jgi:hypothetical protein